MKRRDLLKTGAGDFFQQPIFSLAVDIGPGEAESLHAGDFQFERWYRQAAVTAAPWNHVRGSCIAGHLYCHL